MNKICQAERLHLDDGLLNADGAPAAKAGVLTALVVSHHTVLDDCVSILPAMNVVGPLAERPADLSRG